MDRITAKRLHEICRSRFRMTKDEGRSRDRIYKALSRQPEGVRHLVNADVLETVSAGFVKFTRAKQKRPLAELSCAEESPRQRRRIEFEANTTENTGDNISINPDATGKNFFLNAL